MRTKIALFVAVICFSGFSLRADYFVSGSAAGGRSASANFHVVNNGSANPLLQITLTNTSTLDVTAPTQVLTAVFFGLQGSNPAISIGAGSSAKVATGSTVLFPNVNGDCLANPVSKCSGPDVSGEFAFRSGLTGAPFGLSYGVSSSGLGLFGPGDLIGATNLQGPLSPDGLQYGITSKGDKSGTGNVDVTSKYALIQNSVLITLNLPANTTFNLSHIGAVAFQYGTALTDADFEVMPEPASYAAAIFAMLAPLVFLRWRRSHKLSPLQTPRPARG